jgi:hypothetical protein
MAFNTSGVAQSDSTVDYTALNNYIVEAAGLEAQDTVNGYVSMIVDLGVQKQPDAELVFEGDEVKEREEIAANPNTYFKDGVDSNSKKKVRFKCYPQKPIQSVVLAVDFPDIILDKGQFFGKSDPKPLRLFLGGQFYTKDIGMVVGRTTPLRIRKNEQGAWSFDKKHLFHKMAVAGKIISADDAFLPQDIDKLLGKSFSWVVRVYNKESKGNHYLTEQIKFGAGLSRGQKDLELTTTPYVIQFSEMNDEQALRELRIHVVNTISQAENFSGSIIEKQLLDLKIYKPKDNATVTEQVTTQTAKPVQQSKYEADTVNTDDDLPF